MPNPKLIHPIPVTLELLKVGDTIYDPDTKEPVSDVARETVSLQAQVKFFKENELSVGEQGPEKKSTGYLLFKRTDLVLIGISPKQGDKITKIGHETGLEYFIIDSTPMAYYPDQGGHTLLKCSFQDRELVQ